jgi:SAM-dependent methyltransferase
MNDSAWLEPWVPTIEHTSVSPSILELGCDIGQDTKFLSDHGFCVTALDISVDALQRAKASVPSATFFKHDLREKFPFVEGQFHVVLASLSLHYFSWAKTVEIVSEILRCFTNGGLLVCRLNSVGDFNHGDTGYEEIETNYYRVNGRFSERKRFFDKDSIHRLFERDWNFLSCEEKTIDRYQRPKVVWEILLQKKDA